MIIKIYNNKGVQVAEMPLSQISSDGWSWEEFVDIQAMGGRTCVMCVGQGKEEAEDVPNW